MDGERTGDLIPAAAAYSLRNLSSSYTGNVVDVRRSSDSFEDSFTAAEVADGTLADWVNEIGVARNRTGGARWSTFTSTATGFDGVATAAGGCGYDLIGSSGDSVEVSFDVVVNSGSFSVSLRPTFESGGSVSNSQSISASGNYSFTLNSTADFEAILFVAAASDIEVTNFAIDTPWTYDGFVTQWYDQSGNDNHATQPATSSQPKIVNAGVLVDGGMLFDGVDDFLEANDVAPSFSGTDIPLSCFAVNNYASSPTGAKAVASLGNSSNSKPAFYFGKSNAGGHTLFFRDGSNATASIDFGNTAISTNYLTSAFNDGANQAQFVDGGAAGTTNIDLGLTPLDRFTIGALGRTTNSLYVNASVSEIIVYDSNQSDNRTALEANIGETYGIDLPSGVDTGYDEVDGFVETWYDQSGEGNDAVQTVIGSQPKIVDAGVLVDGGMKFDGVNDFLETDLVPPNIATMIGVANFDRADWSGMVLGARDNTNQRSYVGQTNTGLSRIGVADSFLGGPELVAGDDYLLFGIHDAPLRFLSANGSVVSDSLGSNPNNTTYGYHIGSLNSAGTNGSRMDGKIQEVIIYPSNQSANRTAIETNINNHYNI